MDLDSLVASLSYKPGWTFKKAGPRGRFLCVYAYTVDSSDHHRKRFTQHQFEIPDGLADRKAFARWVFDRLLLIEQHECGEFLHLGRERPFMPHHQGLGDPYERVESWES
jgi:hypothetical protein